MRKKHICILLAVLLLLSGCGGKNAVNEPIELPETAYIDRLFSVDGQLYSVRHGSGAAYINYESAEPSVCYQLPSDDAVWHESSGRLYYSDGYRVYSSDLTGNEKTLVWTFQNKSKEDRADIMAAADDRLLVSGAYWWGGQYPTCDYYSLDVTTGEAVKLMGDVALAFQPELLCTYENTAFLVQKDGKNYRVLAYDLLTGESRELGRFDYEAAIRVADGAVLGDQLYFVCERNGIYSVSLSGGEVEYCWPDTATVPGMDRLIAIEAYDGELYVLMKDGADYPPAAFCRWEAETNLLHPIFTSDGTFSAGNAFLHDGKYYLFTGSKLASGELRIAEGSQNIDSDSQMDDVRPNPWGIMFTAENVSPKGITIVCRHSGGENVAELQTDSYYVIQKKDTTGWANMKYTSSDFTMAWTSPTQDIPKESTTTWDVAWESIYGELPAGIYRIGKEITNFRGVGDYDREMVYADFVIP